MPGREREGEDFREGDRGHTDFKEIVRVWLTLREKWCEKSHSRLPTSDFRPGAATFSTLRPSALINKIRGKPNLDPKCIPPLSDKHTEDMRLFFRKIQGSSLPSFAPSNFLL